ncbi:MAG: Coenzyme F420 hydrogenase/dehydrogenase, beta subunit C-terminal domain [Acidimicrobiales bacterium]
MSGSFRLRAEMNDIAEAPGKVWFWELAGAVIDADRCVRCGACVAACPSDSIGVGKAGLPELVRMCTGCSLCWDFCPRGGLRYEATWLEAGDGTGIITGDDLGTGLGVVDAAHTVRVAGGLRGAQDGGAVSAILVAALESGEIDGALLARSDPEIPWKAVPFLARTAAEVVACAGSFYNQTMALGALDIDRVGLEPDSRIALVGTPCEIQGIRALQARPWRRGRSRVDAVVLTIALMCTKSFDYEGLMRRELGEQRGIPPTTVGKVDINHGKLLVWDTEGRPVVDEPIKAFHGAALKGCEECADFLGRGADISVGSVGSEDGWSSVLVRTEIGAKAFQRARDRLEVRDLDRPVALERLDGIDKKAALASLRRDLDPSRPLFVDFEEHLAAYERSERAPVIDWR